MPGEEFQRFTVEETEEGYQVRDRLEDRFLGAPTGVYLEAVDLSDELNGHPPSDERLAALRKEYEERERDPEFPTAGEYVVDQARQSAGKRNVDYPLAYPSEFDFLAKHGREFAVHPLPDGLSMGEDGGRFTGKCYTNALKAVESNPGRFRYVEGRAGPPNSPDWHWVRHAWVVDEEGRAYEVTPRWDGSASYFGVVIPLEIVQAILPTRGGRGVLEGDELLRQLFAPDDPNFVQSVVSALVAR